MEARYCEILYCEELLLENLQDIEQKLENGIQVHLFLNSDFRDELDLNEYDDEIYQNAKENKLLFIYDNLSLSGYVEGLVAADGNINNEEFYKDVCCDKNSNFNKEQYEIITAPINSNIIVTAGAGTGKTTTMLNRLMYLRKTQDNFTFYNAVLITFTNDASNEMRERLIGLLENYYRVTNDSTYLDMITEVVESNISTIHVFAKNLINEYGKNINLYRKIKIRPYNYLRKQAISEALDRIFKEDKELYDIIKFYPFYVIQNTFLRLWRTLDNYSIEVKSDFYKIDFGVEQDSKFSELIEKVLIYAKEIVEAKKDTDLEVSDLMKKLSNKALLKDIKSDYKVIMVDEFQDSDNIQIDFISYLCKQIDVDLFVVGDEKQSIYRFRGAEHTAFYKLKENLKYSQKKLLEPKMKRNYRTDSSLLKEINELFIDIDKRVSNFNYKDDEHIYSLENRDRSTKIDRININDEDDKFDFFKKLLERKGEMEEIAVLMRTNSNVDDFKEFCDRKHVLCRVDVTGGFYRHQAIRDFYIMVQALISNNDNKVNYALINTPYIDKFIDKNKIIEYFGEPELQDYLNKLLIESNWNKFREVLSKENPLVLIDKIIEACNPVKHYYESKIIECIKHFKNYKEIAYVSALDYKINLEHLVYLLKKNFSENITSIYQIQEFLSVKISTDNEEDIRTLEEKYERKFIKCLTVHKSKGLEFDYVVIPKLTSQFIRKRDIEIILRGKDDAIDLGYRINLEDNEYKNNYFSEYLKDEKSEIIGEETRLFYVAATRCKKKLYLNTGDLTGNASINSWASLIAGGIEHV